MRVVLEISEYFNGLKYCENWLNRHELVVYIFGYCILLHIFDAYIKLVAAIYLLPMRVICDLSVSTVLMRRRWVAERQYGLGANRISARTST